MTRRPVVIYESTWRPRGSADRFREAFETTGYAVLADEPRPAQAIGTWEAVWKRLDELP